MKDLRSDKRTSGDYVICCNCETEMLLDRGEDVCPVCKRIGTLMWADENQERSE